jgi:CBS domain containing-hemolysin-like protein
VSLTVWLVVVVLILANAFYVAAEFGAVGVRRSRVRRLSEDGHAWARLLLPHVQHPAGLDRYVAVSQVGITLSSLILGAVGQSIAAVAVAPHLASLAGLEPHTAVSAAAVLVLFLLTATQVVIGELIPKSLALQFPTEVALVTVLPMRWSLVAFKPFIVLLNGSATGLLRLIGVRLSGHRHLHSPDEIALLFAESRDGGLLEPAEQQRLHKALRLSRSTARDLMVPRDRLAMVDADAPWEAALRVVAASPFSRLPVYRGTRDQVVGMLRVKDLVHRYVTEGPAATVATLVRPVVRVPHTLAGDQLIATLRDKRAHQAAVTDDAGAVVGFVTLHDVLGEFLGATRKAS